MYVHFFLRYYELIDLLITPSDFHRKKLIEFRFPKDKIVHVPNFIDIDTIKPNFEHQNYFIYFGRLSEEKGLLTLIEAMRNVVKGKLVLIGSGSVKVLVNFILFTICDVWVSSFLNSADTILSYC